MFNLTPRAPLQRQVRALVIALSVAVAACGGFKENIEDSARTTSALKSELGFDAQVLFETMNGSHTTVTVRLSKPPIGEAATVRTQITDVVNRSFRNKVERVELVF